MRIKSLIAAMALGIGLGPAAADTFPTKPIHMIVPFNAGGAIDFVGRVLAQGLRDRLGQPVVVENRPGASGNIGTALVAAAAPNGYTLLMESITNRSIVAVLQKEKSKINLKQDFIMVSAVGLVPFVLVVNPTVPAKTLAELTAHAKSAPRPLSFASTGVGSTEHLATELFKSLAGIPVNHIPYTGGGPAISDLVGGHVQAMIATLPTAMPFVSAQTARPIVLAIPDRLPDLPGVPGANEAGLPKFLVSSLYGVLAPAKIDGAIADRLNAAIREVTAQADFKAAMQARGVQAMQEARGRSQALFEDEIGKWEKVVQDAGIKID